MSTIGQCRRCDGDVFGDGEEQLCDQCLDVVLFGTTSARSDNENHFVAMHGQDELDIRTRRLMREYSNERAEFAESLLRLRDILSRQPELIPEPRIELQEVAREARKLEAELIKHLKTHHDHLNEIPADVLEHLIGELFAQRGFDEVRLVGRDPYTSADLYASTTSPAGSRVRFFVEVKRQRERVGIQVVNQVLGAIVREKERFGWHAAILVSLSGFKRFRSRTPEELDLLGLALRDRDDLIRWLDDYEPNQNGLWLPSPLRTILVPGALVLGTDETAEPPLAPVGWRRR